MEALIREINACSICINHLPLGPRPVFQVHPDSRIVIIGQAPGSRVHESGIPWDDKSGENLRKWMEVSREDFYDPTKIALIPMGFCYPGRGKSGDLPPRPECAPQWHNVLLTRLKEVKLTLLIGQYAQAYYLKESRKSNLTETVMHFEDYLPGNFVLPHPSPRNNIWQAKNPWFGERVLPKLRRLTSVALSNK